MQCEASNKVPFTFHICSYAQLSKGFEDGNQSGDQEASQALPDRALCQEGLQRAETTQTHET